MTNGDSQAARCHPPPSRDRVEQAARAGGPPVGRSRGCWTRRAGRNLGLVAVLVAAGASSASSTAGQRSRHRQPAHDPAPRPSVIGVITVGMTFVIIGGGIDLSVGTVDGAGRRSGRPRWPPSRYGPGRSWSSARCAVGAGCGLVNGVLIAYGRIVAVHRHAGHAGLRPRPGRADLGQAAPRSSPTRPSPPSRHAGRARHPAAGLHLRRWSPWSAWVLLNRTTFGRRTFAIGGNPEAARLAGIDVRRHTMLLYVLSGLCCGIAAIMIASPDHDGLEHPRQALRARRHRRRRSSAARC